MLSNKVSEIMTTDLVKAKVSATVVEVMANNGRRGCRAYHHHR